MLFAYSNPYDRDKFLTYCKKIADKWGAGRVKAVEVLMKRPQRSMSQNSYLHVCLGYFAACTGDTVEWVKEEYFKKLCNPQIFVRERVDKFLGAVKYTRSSADLDRAEMTLAIERFRNWSASVAGIYIPAPEEQGALLAAMQEIDKYSDFV